MEEENNFEWTKQDTRRAHRMLGSAFAGAIIFILFFFITGTPSCILREKSPESYFYEGEHCMNDNDFIQAKRYFTKAIKKNPSYMDAYLQRARAYEQLDSFPQAIADYTRVLDSANLSVQKRGELYFSRGSVYYLSMQDTLMCRDFKKACDLNHNKACDFIRKRCK